MPKKNAQPSVSTSPVPERELRAGEQEQADGRRPRPRRSTFDGRAAPASTTVSTSGVNTTNRPVMNAEFEVVVRSSPTFWNQ